MVRFQKSYNAAARMVTTRRRDARHDHQPHGSGRPMISRMSSDQVVRNFLADLEGNYRSLSEIQRQVSTGKRVLTPVRRPGRHRARPRPAPRPGGHRGVGPQHRRLAHLDEHHRPGARPGPRRGAARPGARGAGRQRHPVGRLPRPDRGRGRDPQEPVRRDRQQQHRRPLHLRRHRHRPAAVRPADRDGDPADQHQPDEPRGGPGLGDQRQHHRRPPPGPPGGDPRHLHRPRRPLGRARAPTTPPASPRP